MAGNYIETIHAPPVPLIDIVVVHGLNAWNSANHASRTWTHNGTDYNWIEDLPNLLPPANVFQYRYNANVAFSTADTTVKDQALNLLQALWAIRQQTYRPMVFIAHSLGGLIVKEALASACDEDNQYVSIFTLTYGIVFFGTPHKGASAATWSQHLTSTVRGLTQQPFNDYELSLAPNTFENCELTARFEVLRELYRYISVFETKPFTSPGGLKFIVVRPDSAVLDIGHGREMRIGLDRDHVSLCKFPSSQDGEFTRILATIRSLVQDAVRSNDFTALYDEDLDQFRRNTSVYQLTGSQGAHIPPEPQNAIDLGADVLSRFADSPHLIRVCDDKISELESRKTPTAFGLAFFLCWALSSFAAVIATGAVAIPLLLPIFLKVSSELNAVSSGAAKTLSWHEATFEILASRQLEAQHALQTLRSLDLDDSTDEMKQTVQSLDVRLEQVTQDITHELHTRSLPLLRARRERDAARRALAAAERVAEPGLTPTVFWTVVRDAFQAIAYLLRLILDATCWLFGSVNFVLEKVEEAISALLETIANGMH